MNLYGLPLLVGCTAARGLVSAFFKVPLRNAILYNCVDMVVVGVVHTALAHLVKTYIRGNKNIPGWFSKIVYASNASFVVSRIAGVYIGVKVSKALNYPVRPFHAIEINLASFIAFSLTTALGGDIKHYKLV